MKRVMFGLSVLLAGVAWLTPTPPEQSPGVPQFVTPIDDRSTDLVLMRSEAESAVGLLPEVDGGLPLVAREVAPVR